MPGPDIETEGKFGAAEPIDMVDDDAAIELAQKWREAVDKELKKTMGLKQHHQPELKQVIGKYT